MLFVGADGASIPSWSPIQVLSTNYCVCKCMCARVTALSGIQYSGPSWQQGNFYVIVSSCNVTQTTLSTSVPETVSIRENECQKCRRAGARTHVL